MVTCRHTISGVISSNFFESLYKVASSVSHSAYDFVRFQAEVCADLKSNFATQSYERVPRKHLQARDVDFH